MSITSKKSGLAVTTALVVSLIILVAVAQADPNPYGLDTIKQIKSSSSEPINLGVMDNVQKTELVIAAKIESSESKLNATPTFVRVGDKIGIPGGKIGIPGGKVGVPEAFVKLDGPIIVKNDPIIPGGNISNNGKFQSAVEVEKKLREH